MARGSLPRGVGFRVAGSRRVSRVFSWVWVLSSQDVVGFHEGLQGLDVKLWFPRRFRTVWLEAETANQEFPFRKRVETEDGHKFLRFGEAAFGRTSRLRFWRSLVWTWQWKNSTSSPRWGRDRFNVLFPLHQDRAFDGTHVRTQALNELHGGRRTERRSKRQSLYFVGPGTRQTAGIS